MLKRFCFELGLSPDQTVLSEGQTKRLLETSLSETLDPAGQSELVRLTARFGIEQDDWSRTIKDVVKAALDNDIDASALRKMGAKTADQMLANWPKPTTGTDPTPALLAALETARQAVDAFIQQQLAAGAKVAKNLLEGLDDLHRFERAFRDGRWSWPDWIGAAGIEAGAKVTEPNIVARSTALQRRQQSSYGDRIVDAGGRPPGWATCAGPGSAADVADITKQVRKPNARIAACPSNHALISAPAFPNPWFS